MKILFVEIDTDRDWAVASLGPAFLAAIVRKMGHEATLFRVPVDMPLEEALAGLRDRTPDLIGMSMTTRQWQRGRQVANAIRPFGIPIIAGGLHATFAPEAVLKEPGFDAVCLGEGEVPFAALVTHLAAGHDIADAAIQNIWLKGGTHPGLGPPIPEIDDIPFMARDMLDERWGFANMSTQRGCPFPCTYCAARMYDELYEGIGKYGRRRSHESVFRELEEIRASENGLSYVLFLDDTFTINHPWVFEFCRTFPERIGVPFSIHARVETMNPKLIDALAGAGCRHIVYGVESGSERVRREVMKRPVKNDRLVEIFERTKETGIIVTANYMMGLPGETVEDMRETIALHRRLKPYDFGYFVFYPFPGTQLFHVCKQKGYLPEDWHDQEVRLDQTVLDLPDLPKEAIAETYREWTRIREEDTAARDAEAAKIAEQAMRDANPAMAAC